jgi:hypothetical protein
MNFLMGKGYWEFIIGDEKEPPLPENPTQQQIQANKTWHEKARKVLSPTNIMYINFKPINGPQQIVIIERRTKKINISKLIRYTI